jgi:hypothetical protein
MGNQFIPTYGNFVSHHMASVFNMVHFCNPQAWMGRLDLMEWWKWLGVWLLLACLVALVIGPAINTEDDEDDAMP